MGPSYDRAWVSVAVARPPSHSKHDAGYFYFYFFYEGPLLATRGPLLTQSMMLSIVI
jgi:hypothetical protein